MPATICVAENIFLLWRVSRHGSNKVFLLETNNNNTEREQHVQIIRVTFVIHVRYAAEMKKLTVNS